MDGFGGPEKVLREDAEVVMLGHELLERHQQLFVGQVAGVDPQRPGFAGQRRAGRPQPRGPGGGHAAGGLALERDDQRRPARPHHAQGLNEAVAALGLRAELGHGRVVHTGSRLGLLRHQDVDNPLAGDVVRDGGNGDRRQRPRFGLSGRRIAENGR